MCSDRQSSIIRCFEDLSYLLYMIGLSQIDAGVLEVEFQSLDLRHFCAAAKLGESIIFEQVERAKADKAIREPSDLLGDPVILRLNLFLFVRAQFAGPRPKDKSR